jgi:hypothetical protein
LLPEFLILQPGGHVRKSKTTADKVGKKVADTVDGKTAVAAGLAAGVAAAAYGVKKMVRKRRAAKKAAAKKTATKKPAAKKSAAKKTGRKAPAKKSSRKT